MVSVREYRLPAKAVRSLVWQGENLIDWVDGGQAYALDGRLTPGSVYYPFGFDAAVTSPSTQYSIVYTRLGTKGLILHKGKLVREINRSYYCAESYEYPVAIVQLDTGREILAHCPREYNLLEFEDLESGKVLTQVESRKPSDFFHSRLRASSNGRFLVSAGWHWHPIDEIRAYDVLVALKDPKHLDGGGIGLNAWADESSAAFLPDGRLVVALNGIMRDGIESDENAMPDVEIRTYNLLEPKTPIVLRCSARVGTVFAVQTNCLLSVFEHPRLIDLGTGEFGQVWPTIRTGEQTSSILVSNGPIPPMAVDPQGRRFAVADAEGISILEFGK